jgi:acyl-CoA synthetase (AMP-forming)/AMP-acid ligase II
MMASTGGSLADSIGERFIHLAEKEPNRNWCTYFSSIEDSHTASYGDLLNRSLQFAAMFVESHGVRKRIAICLFQSLDLHASFLGAILAGHIPAMMPPFSAKTEPEKLKKTVQHFLVSMNPDVVVIDNPTLLGLQATSVQLSSNIEVISPSALTVKEGGCIKSQRGGMEIALIQHSSGTTGLQKGVALSHQSIIRHYESYSQAINLRAETDSIVSWLPLYHDMGLISCFIVPLLAGISIVEIPTFLWAAKPGLLFDAITKHKPTLCWLPNFAYTFLSQSLQRGSSLAKWDLSSIRLWTNCSEPVTYQSQRVFLETFEKVGCSRISLGASYAMAENVFAVTQATNTMNEVIELSRDELNRQSVGKPKSTEDTRILVSCGSPIKGVSIKILEPGTETVAKLEVGEIAIKSDFLFSEYWKNPSATAAAFTSDGYFRTGDTGFISGKQVFVTGRLKDIIIIQGKNLHAGDIEDCLSDIEGVVPGRIVALGLTDEILGSERLVVLAETSITDESEKKKITGQIRSKISSELNITASLIKLMPPRWLIKSTSGKIARKENKEKLMKLIEDKHV